MEVLGQPQGWADNWPDGHQSLGHAQGHRQARRSGKHHLAFIDCLICSKQGCVESSSMSGMSWVFSFTSPRMTGQGVCCTAGSAFWLTLIRLELYIEVIIRHLYGVLQALYALQASGSALSTWEPCSRHSTRPWMIRPGAQRSMCSRLAGAVSPARLMGPAGQAISPGQAQNNDSPVNAARVQNCCPATQLSMQLALRRRSA